MAESARPESRRDRQRKSRRIARKAGQAGPSGWRHDQDGDERDLVPPSDVEEFEEWQQRRERGTRTRAGSDVSIYTTTGFSDVSSRSSSVARERYRGRPLEHGQLSQTPSTRSLSLSISRATSPTMPLDFEDDSVVTDESMATDWERETSSKRTRAKTSWPQLVDSFEEPLHSSPLQEKTPDPVYPSSRISLRYGDSSKDGPLSNNHRDSLEQDSINFASFRSTPRPKQRRQQSPLSSSSPLESHPQQTASPESELEDKRSNIMPTLSPFSRPIVAPSRPPLHPLDNEASSSPFPTPLQPKGKQTAEPLAINDRVDRPTDGVYSNLLSSLPVTPASAKGVPGVEGGPLSHVETHDDPADVEALLLDSPLTPLSMEESAANMMTRAATARSSPKSPTPSARPAHPAPPPEPSPADLALHHFRTARTFRTRTNLQLQPYTRERQIYEAALRRGGLKKGKKAIALDREISSLEEDSDPEGEQSESSEAEKEEEDPERIVIGNTLSSPARRRRHRSPIPLVDADYDEYFVEYGTPALEDDEEAAVKLQTIARIRVKAAKEERRRLRRQARAEKEFERLLKQRPDGHDRSASSGNESPSPVRLKKTAVMPTFVKRTITKSTAKTTAVEKNAAGQQKTYGARNRHKSPVMPAATGRATRVVLSSSPPETAQMTSAPPPFSNHYSSRHATEIVQDFSMGDEGGFTSFLVDDIPSPPRQQGKSPERNRPSGSGSDASSSVSEIIDKRQRIARRMLPAAMLRRLEREADDTQRKKEAAKRREARGQESPVRPGRAVVRRAQANGDVIDFVNLIASEGESSESSHTRSPSPASLHQQEIVLFANDEDDEDAQSSGSQAQEDYYAGAQSLARLYDGDFETIIAGKRPPARCRGDGPRNQRDRQRRKAGRRSRPALGLVKRVRDTPNSAPRPLYQSRLDFPVESPTLANKNHSNKKRKAATVITRTPRRATGKDRPAIRLDDNVIFSNADFAFDQEEAADPLPVTPAASRPFRRTVSKPSLPPLVENVDSGVGKARSWANFDKFSVDFGISPLPSGLCCHPESYVGSLGLSDLVRFLREGYSGFTVVEPVSAHGVELRGDMSPAAINSVVKVVFDGTKESMTAFANELSSEALDLSPLMFLGQYLTARRSNVDGDTAALRCTVAQALVTLSVALDDFHLIAGSVRYARDSLVSMRIALLDLACRVGISAGDALMDHNPVVECALALLKQLLAIGFDKAVRPLKKVLRGESESPEIGEMPTTAWIAVMQILEAWSAFSSRPSDAFDSCLEQAIDQVFHPEDTGPIAAERIWFLTFGLCAFSQFGANGRTSAAFTPAPRWSLVRRAVGLIKISHTEEAEEKAHIDQLQGRDRYIKAMIARCVRLSAVWKWSFDRQSFSVATKDLGVIFKNRQYRNLPTEPPVDYPDFVTHFDMSLTAAEDTRHETAFEMYLRLVCVAASDLISRAESLQEAQQAERDVQRLIMSIIPVSPVKFSRILPPTPRQIGQLINRYSTMIAACYFSPSLLSWLLANSRKWISFESADFESRQICIRGLMYLAVACRHHDTSLDKVVDSLAGILGTLQQELDAAGKPSAPANAPLRKEVERTMVLVVACFRQIIQRHSFDPEVQAKPRYPDPCLLHESWTGRIFALDLANDYKCGTEVVATIQAYLDTRASALPRLARQRREAREQRVESQDEYSFGIDFSEIDLEALGGEAAVEDPVQKLDEQFALIINNVISPQIYRLLSDMLPPVEDEEISADAKTLRQVFISKLTKCWSDCAGVIVVEQNSADGWDPYVGPFGKESWQRFGNEHGRLQVGLHFMLNVARIDPGSYQVFLGLLFQSIVTDRLTIEHKFLSALLAMPGVLDCALLADVGQIPAATRELDRTTFMEIRSQVLEAIFGAIPTVLGSPYTPSTTKTSIYRCVNLLASTLVANEKSISPDRVIHKESYHEFASQTARDLVRLAGEYMTPMSIPALKHLV